MSGVKRVFVEKKKPYAVKAKELHDEIAGYLGIKTISQVRVLIRYDIENLSEETYTQPYFQNHRLMMYMKWNFRQMLMISYFP